MHKLWAQVLKAVKVIVKVRLTGITQQMENERGHVSNILKGVGKQGYK